MKTQTVVNIKADKDVLLEGDLIIPSEAVGIVLFAHGSGSSRHSKRNKYVAHELNKEGLATLLFDLLSGKEESVDITTGHLRFDIQLLAKRLIAAVDFLKQSPKAEDLKIGLFGSSTGGGAALVAAARRKEFIHAVVSRGGRPDLAGEALPLVEAPTLLIVGANDPAVIHLNEDAFGKLRCEKKMEIIPGASHLFEEPGTLEEVALLATSWFHQKLQ